MKNYYFSMLFASILLVSCAKDERNTVRVIAGANQENYQHFYLNLATVQAKFEESDGRTIWYELQSNPGLVDLAADNEWLIGSKNDLHNGKLKSIRFLFKDGNYYEQNGDRKEISNATIEVSADVERALNNSDADIKIDFALEKSLYELDRQIYVKPVISAN
jgi:hypothetical protein